MQETSAIEHRREAFIAAIARAMDRDGDAGFLDPVGWRGRASLYWDLTFLPKVLPRLTRGLFLVKALADIAATVRQLLGG